MATRIISAAIALPLVIACVQIGGWLYLALVSLVGAISLHEFGTMTMPRDRASSAVVTLLGTTFLVAWLTGQLAGAAAIVLLPVITIPILLLFVFRTGDMATVGSRLSFAMAGLLWAGGLFWATVSLRLLPDGAAWLYLACILAWASDTGAYFAGRFLGRHKLYEKVSPKKTWEGSIGGVIVATVGAFLFVFLVGAPEIPAAHLAVLAPVGAALGQVGDLAESLLKRSMGVKDSGSIMPGHGGLFDRVDALIFCGAFLLAYAALMTDAPFNWVST